MAGTGGALRPMATLADRIDDVLPQTQCGQCGFGGCRPYADALARAEVDINRCPPGGVAGQEFTAGRGRGAGGVLGVSQSLPFTGFTIAFAFFAAFALISGGAALRRSARER